MAEPKGPRGSITQTADAQQERIQGISNVAKTVNAMSQKSQSEINQMKRDVDTDKSVKEISSSMTGVLDKLNQTIAKFGDGVKDITVNTAKATSDAISQYSKAVGEDISFNKRNIIAMSLARATPLFGYFAAKFMETDVFKSAAEKMKSKIGDMFGGLFGRFRGKKADTDEYEVIPKLQRGGYVRKGGLVEVHAGEIVAPVEKVLSRIDEQQKESGNLTKALRRWGMQMYGFRGRTLGIGAREDEKAAKTWIGSFINAWRSAQEEEALPMAERQLRALIAIQDALGTEYDTREQIWNKFLLDNPTFRSLYMLSQGLNNILVKPAGKLLYGLVRGRGARWKPYLSRAKAPLVAMNENIATMFTHTMPMLNRIQLYTRAGAEASRDLSSLFTGKRYGALPDVVESRWSWLGLLTKTLFFLPKMGAKLFMGGFNAILKKFAPNWKKTIAVIDWLHNAAQKTLSGPGALIDLLLRPDEDREFLGDVKATTLKGKRKWWGGRAEVEHDPNMFQQIQQLLPQLNELVPKFIHHLDFDKIILKHQAKQVSLQQKTLMIEDKQLRTQKENMGIMKRIRKGLAQGRFMQMFMGIFGWVSSMASKLFGILGNFGGFLAGALKTAFPALVGALSSGGALASFIGPAAGVLAAGLVGAGIGTLINKYIIAPFRDKWFNTIDEANKKARGETAAATARAQEMLKSDDPAVRRRGQAILKGGIDIRTKEAQKDMRGFLGGLNVAANLKEDQVRAGQLSFIEKNVNEYSKYSPEEIRRVRAKYHNEGGFSALGFFQDANLYGERAEKHFLSYLKKEGNTMAEVSALGRAAMQATGVAQGPQIRKGYAVTGEYTRADQMIDQGGRVIGEKMRAIDVDAAAYAIDEGVQMVANRSVDVQEQLLAENKEMNQRLQNLEKGLSASINTINTNVSNSVNSAVNSPAGQAAKGLYDTAHGYYAEKLTQGAVK